MHRRAQHGFRAGCLGRESDARQHQHSGNGATGAPDTI